MILKLYKLSFKNQVRFGLSNSGTVSDSDFGMKSDTLFSAIYIEWIRIYGEEKAKVLIDNKIELTDLLPFENEELFIPKPVVLIERLETNYSSVAKKKMKNLKFIPISKISQYMNSLRGVQEMPDFCNPNMKKQVVWKNHIDYNGEATPYAITTIAYGKNAGVYFLIKMPKSISKKMDLVIESLGTSGIGGGKSRGYGKFKLYQEPIILEEESKENDYYKDLKNRIDNKYEYYVLLSTMIPTKESIDIVDSGFYQLSKRSGFITSLDYMEQAVKRKDIVMITSGSTFEKKFEGMIQDLSIAGSHPVYRNGYGLFIGV